MGARRMSKSTIRVEAEIHHLSQNMLAGILSPTLAKMLAEREAEHASLKAQVDRVRPTASAKIPPPGTAAAV